MQSFVERRFIVFDGFLKAPVCYLWAGIKHLSDPSTCSSFAADKFISDIKRLFFLLKLLRFFSHFLCFWRKFLKDSYLFFKYSMEFTREIISLWLFLI